MMKLKFAGVAAALAVALTGCGSSSTGGTGGGSGGGGGSAFCTSTSCASGQTCHPTSRTCVKTCSSGNDCSAEAKNCAAAIGATGTIADGGSLLVCSCVTTALCSGTSGVTGNICSDVDRVCLAKCTSNSNCPNNRTCDTTSGQCGTAGGSDAGTMDAGVACTRGSCTSPKICTFATGVCEAPKSCVTANAQPDTCGYGQFCSAASCAEVVVGSCNNFAAGSNPTLWNPKTSTGPVIYALSKFSFGTDATFCGAGTSTVRAKVHVKAYAQTGVLISESGQPALNYVRTTMNESAVLANQIQNYVSTNGGKDAEFDVNFCAPDGTTALTVGLYYTGGNASCFTAN